MKTTTRILSVLFTTLCASLSAAPVGGCASSAEDTCSALRGALKRCGMPTATLDCGRIDRTAQEALLARLGSKGCQGVSDTDPSAVDPRLCAIGNWPCPSSPTPEPGTRVPVYPVVFVSGIDGSPAFDWNPGILEALKRAKVQTAHVSVLPWATTEERAADLWLSLESLKARTGAKKFNLICYAVGGLDCRYLVSPNGLMKNRAADLKIVQSAIASISTIATPHRGTRVAEAALSAVRSGTASDLLSSLVGALADGTAKVPEDAAIVSTLEGLTLSATFTLNQTLRDAEGIYYQSWAGVSHVLGKTSDASEEAIRAACINNEGALSFERHKGTRDSMNELLWFSSPFGGTSLNAEGTPVQSPADGMVSVESAKWGTFRGCLPADHYDVIGQIGHSTRDPMTGFDAPRFYRTLASDLAERSF
jgi:triacylglycerol lipase